MPPRRRVAFNLPTPSLTPQQARDKNLHPYVPPLAAKLRRMLGQCQREAIAAIEWGPGLGEYNAAPSYEAYLIVPGKRVADVLDIGDRLRLAHLDPEQPGLPHRFIDQYLEPTGSPTAQGTDDAALDPSPASSSSVSGSKSPSSEEGELRTITIYIFDAAQLGLSITSYTLYEMALDTLDPLRNSYRPDVIVRARTYLHILCGASKWSTPPVAVAFYARVKTWLSSLVLYDLMGFAGSVEAGDDGYLYPRVTEAERKALAKEGLARIESLHWRLGQYLWVKEILRGLVTEERPYEKLTRELWCKHAKGRWKF